MAEGIKHRYVGKDSPKGMMGTESRVALYKLSADSFECSRLPWRKFRNPHLPLKTFLKPETREGVYLPEAASMPGDVV